MWGWHQTVDQISILILLPKKCSSHPSQLWIIRMFLHIHKYVQNLALKWSSDVKKKHDIAQTKYYSTLIHSQTSLNLVAFRNPCMSTMLLNSVIFLVPTPPVMGTHCIRACLRLDNTPAAWWNRAETGPALPGLQLKPKPCGTASNYTHMHTKRWIHGNMGRASWLGWWYARLECHSRRRLWDVRSDPNRAPPIRGQCTHNTTQMIWVNGARAKSLLKMWN